MWKSFVLVIAVLLGVSTFFIVKCYILQNEINENKALMKRALEFQLRKIDQNEILVEKITEENLNRRDSIYFNELSRRIQIQNKYVNSIPDDNLEIKLQKAFEVNDTISNWFNSFTYCPPKYNRGLHFFNPLPNEYPENELVTFRFFVTYFKESYFSGRYLYFGSSDSSVIETSENTFQYSLKTPKLNPTNKSSRFKRILKLYFKNYEINKMDTVLILLKFDVVSKE